MMKNKVILVLAPHTDDGELGAGGYIHKSIESGAHVTYVAFSDCKESVPEGFKKNILSVAEKYNIYSSPTEIFDYLNFNWLEGHENIPKIYGHIDRLKK